MKTRRIDPQEIPWLARIVESPITTGIVTAAILVAAVLIGLETYPSVVAAHGTLLHTLDAIVLGIFVVEVIVKMARHGRRPWMYFRDPWNVFDFIIVAVCLLPLHTQYAAVLRLARIMRVMRLMSALPQLQLLVGALIKSIPSMGYVGVLLLMHFYIYAVMGVFLFRDNDPVHFRDLPTSMLSLFRVVTLEDWTDIMYIQMYGSDVYAYDNITHLETAPQSRPLLGALYFVSFVMFGTMIMLNLFIGVILNSMNEEQAQRERESLDERLASGAHVRVSDEIRLIEQQLQTLTHSVKMLRIRCDA